MASLPSPSRAPSSCEFCISCGIEAVTGNRRLIKSDNIGDALANFLLKRLTSNDDPPDDLLTSKVHSLMKKAFLCRKCYSAYQTYVNKGEALYELTGQSCHFVKSQLDEMEGQSREEVLVSPLSSTTRAARSAGTPRKRLYSQRNSCTVSPSVSVVIPYQSGSKTYKVAGDKKKITKSIVRSTCPERSLAANVLRDPKARSYVTKGMGKILLYELKMLCSFNNNSVLRRTNCSSISSFPWEAVFEEIQTHCPTLYSLLLSCTSTKHCRQNQQYFIAAITCMLCKFRCKSMSLYQKMISMILYAGHCGTKVYDQLSKFMFCVGKSAAHNLVTLLGSNYNLEVLSWMEGLVPKMDSNVSDYPLNTHCQVPVVCEYDCDESEESEHEAEDPDESICKSDEEMNHLVDSESNSIASNESIAPPCFSDFTGDSLDHNNSFIENVTVENEQNDDDNDCNIWSGFKLVGDNVDKNIRRRYVRLDQQTISFHGFHYYAVRDRIDLSGLSDDHKPPFHLPVSELPIHILLPSDADHLMMINNFAVYVSRVLFEELAYFSKTFDNVITWHISHPYSTEMSQKSKVIPLGVIDRNENCTEEMIDILMEMHQYVPMRRKTLVEPVTQREVSVDICHTLLVGGDQLTRKRIETAKDMRRNSISPETELNGLMPVCEDWHARGIFLEVVWKYFYKTSSFMETGTMCQLRNLIDRRNVSASVDKDFAACDDFFKLVTRSHILAAAMKFLSMKDVHDAPSHYLLSDGLWSESEEVRKDVLISVCKEIVMMFVDLGAFSVGDDTYDDDSSNNDEEEDGKEDSLSVNRNSDKVQLYASKVLTMGCIYCDYCDAIKEGDGLRILRTWRYLMILFKKAQRKNYAIESLNLLGQYHFFLPPRLAEQLIWSRCVNTSGQPGKNISCDLMMEHLNRLCKMSVGSYKTVNSICRAAKCLGVIQELEENFNETLSVSKDSNKHPISSAKKDLSIILEELLAKDVFGYEDNRQHNSFKDIRKDDRLNSNKINKWMKGHLEHLKQVMYL